MSDLEAESLRKGYRDFLVAKLERGSYDAVLARLPKGARAEVYKEILTRCLDLLDPKVDAEFMDRVGDQLTRRVTRIEKNLE